MIGCRDCCCWCLNLSSIVSVTVLVGVQLCVVCAIETIVSSFCVKSLFVCLWMENVTFWIGIIFFYFVWKTVKRYSVLFLFRGGFTDSIISGWLKDLIFSKMSKGKVNNLSMCLDISSVKRNACSTLIQLSHCFSVKSSFNANKIGFRTHRQSLMTKSMIHIQIHAWFVMHMHLTLTVDFCFNQWLILVTLCSKIKISL